jgi:phage terminase large subunit-like protein
MVLADMRDKAREERLSRYSPHPKQAEFHVMGKEKRLRLLSAGNQFGKSEAGSAEIAYHTTGLYPEDWEGRRCQGASDWWVGGDTAETLRDIVQEKLLGPIEDLGTGWIPKGSIINHKLKRSIANAVDYVVIRHVEGGLSRIYFKSYEQGRKKWQGKPITGGIWLDEEPPADIWAEAMARTTATQAMLYMTFTPLQGPTPVVRSFWPTPDAQEKGYIVMGLEDALHIPKERHEDVIRQYPVHERRARVDGLPVLGEGHVYPIERDQISCSAFEIPSHFAQIMGLDLGRGGEHPTAWVHMAYDRDMDIVYVTDMYTGKSPMISVHASSMRRHKGVVVAWPHDGSMASGQGHATYADLYRREGTRMLRDHATTIDGSNSVEAGILEVFNRMVTGRFKVFDHLYDFFVEIEGYYRKNGKIVKENDDLLDAARYGVMMLRYATSGGGVSRRGMPRYARSWNPLRRLSDGSYARETRH